MGIFSAFLEDKDVHLTGVEAGGKGLETGQHAAALLAGRTGVLHGARSFLLQDESGQIRETYSISAGLDYPGVGPQHSYLKQSGRAAYVSITDEEALEGSRSSAVQKELYPPWNPHMPRPGRQDSRHPGQG